jgi:hypothetical protein
LILVNLQPSEYEIEERQRQREARDKQVRWEQKLALRKLKKPKRDIEKEYQCSLTPTQ